MVTANNRRFVYFNSYYRSSGHSKRLKRRSQHERAFMKKILLGTTMLAGLLVAGVAQAADMPAKAGPRAEPFYSSWAGFYLGIHGGYGWGDVNFDEDISPFSNPRPRGGLVGGHAGYLWQWSNWVGGLEIDYSAASLKQDQSVVIEDVIITTITLSSKIDALGSARARLGWLWTPNLLAYGTAGLGWAHSKVISCADDFCQSSAESSFGWVAGAGLEYQFANNWRLRAEYLHYDFGTVTYLGNENANLRVDVVRGALSVKF